MLRLKHFFLPVMLICFISLSYSQNPITMAKGVSDPHIRVFNDTIYLYSGHDSSPTDKIWDMKDWRVFSTTNLLDWKLEETISPSNNYMPNNSSDCWASDAASRNGKYYFYFSDQKRGIGVMESNFATGPFKDALGKPLVAPLHDPTIFVDNDKDETPYIIYGDKSDAYYVAKLNEDMISTAESPKPIHIAGKAWEEAPGWMDKNYVFKHKDTYYLSWGNNYATSRSIYGPYKTAGSFGKGHHLDEFAHGSFFWWKGQFYHVWCYYINKGFKFRESIISYCHIGDDGTINTDTSFLDQHLKNGVGQYNADWLKIEAEWFYEKSSEIEKTGNNTKGFKLSNIKNNTWLKYTNVKFSNKASRIELVLKHLEGFGEIEIRQDRIDGQVLANVSLEDKGDKNENQKLISDFKSIDGVVDIYIIFKGNQDFQIDLDYFSFK